MKFTTIFSNDTDFARKMAKRAIRKEIARTGINPKVYPIYGKYCKPIGYKIQRTEGLDENRKAD
jgi:hypothetical protein